MKRPYLNRLVRKHPSKMNGRTVANVFVLVLIIVLSLLALQAEAVTATLGWILAGILMLALISSVIRKG